MKRPLTALAGAALVAASLSVSAPATASGVSSDDRIQMQDDCEQVSFEAALGAGACGGDGDTTFSELVSSLLAGRPDGKWRMHSDDTHVRRGHGLHIKNTGGEFHTFTEVSSFGPGCVSAINDLMGLSGAPAADCGAAFGDARTALPAGGSGTLPTAGMSVGTHLFECMVHPWMTARIDVRRR